MKDKFVDKLYEAAKKQNHEEYIDLKYSELSDGDNLVFADKDFTGFDLRNYALPFTRFENCVLDGCRLSGLPIGISNCERAGIDVRGERAFIFAENSNFTDCLWDESTQLGPDDANSDGSVFSNCVVTDEFKNHFSKQGVVFTENELPAQNKI